MVKPNTVTAEQTPSSLSNSFGVHTTCLDLPVFMRSRMSIPRVEEAHLPCAGPATVFWMLSKSLMVVAILCHTQ